MSKIKIYEAGEQLNRIANALDEILRLVKLDQEKTAKRMREYDNEDAMLDDLSKPWKETK
jgi:hypothetical protein